MAQYIDISEARVTPGLRIVLPPGRANPWGEALKGICELKGIPFTRVRKAWGHDEELQRWTCQSSAPVLVYENERPRSLWNDQLYLLERLSAWPRMIPSAPGERALMFGLANELCGEGGFAWQRRLMLIDADLNGAPSGSDKSSFATYMAEKYGHDAGEARQAPVRAAAILRQLSIQLERQHAAGSRFLVGNEMTALDVYWATFAVLIVPLPPSLCPILDELRSYYTLGDPVVRAAVSDALMQHRDYMYREHLSTPLDL
jgi:glutathione S-transferase